MKEFDALIDIVRLLRSKKGCKWDRAQKLKNLKGYLLEEVYELIDAMNGRNVRKIEEEMGDVFLLLVSITHLYAEKGKFKVNDVLKKINAKLVNRHPHVFAQKKVKNKDEILTHWIKSKVKDKKRKTIFDRLPQEAPSLLLGYILCKENKYLGKNVSAKKLKTNILKELRALTVSRNKEKVFSNIFLSLLELAAQYKIEMETPLRRSIFREAKKVKY